MKTGISYAGKQIDLNSNGKHLLNVLRIGLLISNKTKDGYRVKQTCSGQN